LQKKYKIAAALPIPTTRTIGTTTAATGKLELLDDEQQLVPQQPTSLPQHVSLQHVSFKLLQ